MSSRVEDHSANRGDYDPKLLRFGCRRRLGRILSVCAADWGGGKGSWVARDRYLRSIRCLGMGLGAYCRGLEVVGSLVVRRLENFSPGRGAVRYVKRSR